MPTTPRPPRAALVAGLRVLPLLLLALALPRAAAAQDGDAAAPEAPQATFTAGVDFVRVDVIVTADGEPVVDLTADDFEIIEDGAAQAIEEFRLVRVDGLSPALTPPQPIRTAADERREAARDDARIIVFFLDDYHTQFGSAVTARTALVDFIRTSLGPNDLIAVMGPLTPMEAVRLTRDHEAVIREIQDFEGRRFRYDPRNTFEENYAFYSAAVIENLRNQVVISALAGLATHLGTVREGRKSVIYVSEGMAATPPAGLRNLRAGMGGPTNPLEQDGGGRPDSLRLFRQGDLQDRLRDIYAAASRHNTAIYTLDPRGLGGDAGLVASGVDLGASRDYQNDARTVLRLIAEGTDGRAIVSRNDLAEGLAQVVQDSSVYYLLGYTSPAPPDGAFHEFEVRVRRPGVRVRARPGYWAASEADVQRAATPAPRTPSAVTDALASIADPVRAARAVRLWTGATRAGDGGTALTVVWEPLPPPPGVRRDAPARVLLTAVTPDGDLVFRGRVPEEAGGGAPYRVTFDAAPGLLELDLSVEGETGARVDTLVREVEVPAFPADAPGMSTPRVFRARTAVEFRALAAAAAAVPTPSREFQRSERLLVRFDVYAGPGGPPAVSAALLNRGGDPMAAVPVQPADAGGTHQIDLGLSSMPPGEYLLEITLEDGDAPVLVPLRISG